jgi:hypothetical protein
MPVAAFILSLVQPILARVLVSLGFSLVSFVGFDLALNQVIQAAEGAWVAFLLTCCPLLASLVLVKRWGSSLVQSSPK